MVKKKEPEVLDPSVKPSALQRTLASMAKVKGDMIVFLSTARV
jgi:hypothetical protein